jgi:uncharacterized protein DUF5335
MAIQKVETSEWRPFLDGLSRVLSGKPADIEIASLRLGDQIQAERLPLLGLAYDPKSDIIEVARGQGWAILGFSHAYEASRLCDTEPPPAQEVEARRIDGRSTWAGAPSARPLTSSSPIRDGRPQSRHQLAIDRSHAQNTFRARWRAHNSCL